MIRNKYDMKCGNIVKLKDGRLGLLCATYHRSMYTRPHDLQIKDLKTGDMILTFGAYNDDLKCKYNEKYDIVNVWNDIYELIGGNV